MRRLLVIGGGPAGLATAFWRQARDPALQVLVHEAAPRVGGHVRSERRDGYLCEWGPQALRPTAGSAASIDALGLGGEVVAANAAATTRWFGRRGQLAALPARPGALLRSPLLSLGAKLRVLVEPCVRARTVDGETLADFVRRRFGRGCVPFADAIAAGVFAGSARELEVASAFPTMVGLEHEHGSVLRGARHRRGGEHQSSGRAVPCSFRGGMQALVDALAARTTVRTDCAVRALGREHGRFRVELAGGKRLDADEVVLAAPAWAAAEIVRTLDTELADELAAIPFAPVANVWLGQNADPGNALLRGFGFLLDGAEPTAVLGVIYASELFAEQAPPGRALFRVMLGGTRHADALGATDAVLCGAASAALETYARARTDFAFAHVVRIERAIPQFVVGHAARLARIAARVQRHPGLALCGNSYRSVALGDQLAPPPGSARAQEAATACA